jgi:putative ABC transport system substrate-binding protein
MYLSERSRIVALASKLGVPTGYMFAEFVREGGLVGYGSNLTANYRRAADFVDRILRGANPADLPVEQQISLSCLSTRLLRVLQRLQSRSTSSSARTR